MLNRHDSPKQLSLAILPLHSRPASPDLDSISDGLTEGLINSASRLPGIRVMARTTAFAFKARSDGWQVGRELKVSYVLYGSVDQNDDKLNVNVELVDVADGSRAWGRRYSVQRRDVPAIQQLIGSELAAALKVRPNDVHPEPSTTDAEAYRLYLKGRQLWNQRTLEGLTKSIEVYRQAIARDPQYALAYAGMADSYGLIGFGYGLPTEYYPQARAAATKALELDPSLAEAETSLAMVNALYDWNWPTAEAQFRRAIDINPGYATAHHWLGVHLAAMGRFSEAKEELDKALSLDPRSPIVVLNSGYPELYQRKYEDALAIFQRALEINPAFSPAHEDLVTIFELQHKPEDAAREWNVWLRSEGRIELANRLSAAGRGNYETALRESLQAFEAESTQRYVSPMLRADTSMRLGDRDEAFRWLGQAVEQRSPELVYLAVDPKYDPLRGDRRFAALLHQIGLDQR
jgi:TolB-like protein/Flp pilus assembly protein TadD